MIDQIPKAVRDVLGIASPSKVFAEIGGYVGLGLQQGMTSSIGTALDSAKTQLRNGIPRYHGDRQRDHGGAARHVHPGRRDRKHH